MKQRKSSKIKESGPASAIEICMQEYRSLSNAEPIGTVNSEGWNWDVVRAAVGFYGLKRTHNDAISILYSIDKPGSIWRIKTEYYSPNESHSGPKMASRSTELFYRVSSEITKITNAYESFIQASGNLDRGRKKSTLRACENAACSR